MAAWFIPAVKAILPFVSPIVSAALPVFTTRKSDEATTSQSEILQRQISELQTAASQNALHVKELAEQLQNQFGGGQIRAVDVLRQEQLVAATRQQKAAEDATLRVLENRLAILLGHPPQEEFPYRKREFPKLDYIERATLVEKR